MQIVNNLFATFLFILCGLNVSAQTTYNQVTLDRGKGPETNCIYICNDNSDSVRVLVQYKIGSRQNDWIDYPITELIPPSIEPQKIGCIDSTIIGLKLVDVIIIRSNSKVNDKITSEETKNDNSLLNRLKSLFL